MRSVVVCIAVVMTSVWSRADEPRWIFQDYLNRGDLTNGELELQAVLESHPGDDQIRFALGMLRMARSVERLGQSLYRYGIRSEMAATPILRLPVPANPDPAPISYVSFRRLFEDFYRDLELVESTLATIQDDDVHLPLKLAGIHLDLTADGDPSERFGDLLTQILRNEPSFLDQNPEFLVRFDRGDVAWMRAYCHLLMALSDVYLSFDTKPYFESTAERQFAKVIRSEHAESDEALDADQTCCAVQQPRRLGHFRRHMIEVVRLNHETWDHIRAESDDDHEWLPNANQKQGVLGLPVQDEMIDAWLAMADEAKALLEGERAFLKIFFNKAGKGIDLKVFLEDPPDRILLSVDYVQDLPDRYFTDAQDINLGAFIRVFSMLQNTTGVGYAAWFN